MDASNSFWEIRRGSELNLPFLARGHNVIFLDVRLVFQSPFPPNNYCTVLNLFRQVNKQDPGFDEGVGCQMPQ